jgi:hypothetical protein
MPRGRAGLYIMRHTHLIEVLLFLFRVSRLVSKECPVIIVERCPLDSRKGTRVSLLNLGSPIEQASSSFLCSNSHLETQARTKTQLDQQDRERAEREQARREEIARARKERMEKERAKKDKDAR